MLPLSLKDVVGLNRLAGVLVIPFVAAATYTQFGLWPATQDWSLGPFALSPNPVIAVPVRVFFFFVLVAIAAFAVTAVQWLLFQAREIFVLSGFAALTFGVLALEHLVGTAPHSQSLLFWQLAAVCYGLDVFTGGKANGT